MLGAQVIRTKQKNREKKKKLSCATELQCERIQKAAREDEAKFLEKFANLHLDARTVSEIAEETRRKQRRHHSVQEPSSVRIPSIDDSDNPRLFSKNSSTSFTKAVKPEKSGMDFVNIKETVNDKKNSRWCGLLASSPPAGSNRLPSKKPPKRRMSTFL